MLRIKEIANVGNTVKINYSQIDNESGKIEKYSVKSNRTPVPEFFEAWNSLKSELPSLMLVKGDECNLELRQITLKHSSDLSEQMDYKVQFSGSVYNEEDISYQFKTGIKEGFWATRDKNEEGEYIGTGKEHTEAVTEKINAVIEHTLAYINGASAQGNLFPENDSVEGVDGVEEDGV
jgi:hypothetical protein